MAKHTLSLEVQETLNCSILRIDDTSKYAEGMVVDCPILLITLPGFSYSIEVLEPLAEPGFSLNLTACDLEVQTIDCDGGNFSALPDGIYVIKYSVSPNEQVYVEYNHLRLSKILNDYNNALCNLDLQDCAPDVETAKKLEVLREVKMYLDAAKAKVETCHEPKKGMDLYTYAKKQLSRFNCTSCYK